jgi:hypothetical protein
MEKVLEARRTVEALESVGLPVHEVAIAQDRLIEAFSWLNFLRARIPGGDKYYNYGGE